MTHQNNEMISGRYKQALGLLSIVIAVGFFSYIFYVESHIKSLQGFQHVPKEIKKVYRKLPDNLPFYNFEWVTKGVYSRQSYQLIQEDLTNNKGKWTFLFIGTIKSHYKTPISDRQFHEREGAFLNDIYKWVDHKKTNVVFVNAATPDGPPGGQGDFSDGCEPPCFDKYLQGGVRNNFDRSYYNSTQHWLSEIVYGVPYSESRTSFKVTSLPIVIIIDDNGYIREVMPKTYTASTSTDYYERLLHLQYGPNHSKYSDTFLNKNKNNASSSFISWTLNKIKD